MAKISDKLVKINDSFTIHIYDNGYMLEVSGRDSDSDYKTAKIMCSTISELLELVEQACVTETDN